MKIKADLWRILALVAILLVVILIVAKSYVDQRIRDEIPPIGRPLSKTRPKLFERELKEHRDAQKSEPKP